MRECSQDTTARLKDCVDYADAISGANKWSLRAYYARESWFLVVIVGAVPLLAYGLCRGLLATGLWVGRGFQS